VGLDRDTLLPKGGLDLAGRELLPRLADGPPAVNGCERALAMSRPFADHRAFYRAPLTGPCACAQVLFQSVRGGFGSGGTFDPMRQEREDGLATLDWLVKQPWCGKRWCCTA
jgi:hypothetical protein